MEGVLWLTASAAFLALQVIVDLGGLAGVPRCF
jgi:hypothetical protein